MFQDRRGASETIGFVLIFSLIVLTVGVVLTVGYGGLQDARDAERVNNAERAFDVLADNLEDITHRGAPSRGTEIRLSEASLGAGSPTYLNVTGLNGTGAQVFSTGNYSTDTVVYEAEDTQIRYAAGAVTRVQQSGSMMVVPPEFVLAKGHTIVPIVQLSVDDRTVAGSQTVLVRTERRIRNVVVSENGGVETLRVNVSTPAPNAWGNYLRGQGLDCTEYGGSERGKLVCTLSDVERVKIVWFELKVSFE